MRCYYLYIIHILCIHYLDIIEILFTYYLGAAAAWTLLRNMV